MKRYRIRPGSIADYCLEAMEFMAFLTALYALFVLGLCL